MANGRARGVERGIGYRIVCQRGSRTACVMLERGISIRICFSCGDGSVRPVQKGIRSRNTRRGEGDGKAPRIERGKAKEGCTKGEAMVACDASEGKSRREPVYNFSAL